MKTVKEKYLVVGADFAGFPLKEAVVAHLKEKGWKITDLGVTNETDPEDPRNRGRYNLADGGGGSRYNQRSGQKIPAGKNIDLSRARSRQLRARKSDRGNKIF